MSKALVNRSLTTIRTELEFLSDSEVISEELYHRIEQALPAKYEENMKPWGVEKLDEGADMKPNPKTSIDTVSERFEETKISAPVVEPPRSEATPEPDSFSMKKPLALGYCRASYDYAAQEPEDLNLRKNDLIAIVEHLSEDWWKGYRSDDPSHIGVFPSNYVNIISQQEFENSLGSFDRASTEKPPLGEKQSSFNSSSTSLPPPGYYQGGQQMGPPLSQQNSYGGYAQYPPPSTNYYPPQQYGQQPQQQQVPVEEARQHGHLRKFGGKLGNAAIFGAGATIGSDIVNSIF